MIKTLIVECKFTIEVPWDESWGNDDDAKFRIEENSCPGTGPVDGVLSEMMDAAEEVSVCWACNLTGKNKLIATEDRPPVNYVDRIKAIPAFITVGPALFALASTELRQLTEETS